MITLGIDPGVERIGFAILEKKSGSKPIVIHHSGLISTTKDIPHEKRLFVIYTSINKLINKYRPNCLVIEKLFYTKNAKTAIPVAQAQGVLYLAASQHNLPIYSLSPNSIKMRVTGYGNADKIAIKKMVDIQLSIPPRKRVDDEYDAIACALAYLVEMN